MDGWVGGQAGGREPDPLTLTLTLTLTLAMPIMLRLICAARLHAEGAVLAAVAARPGRSGGDRGRCRRGLAVWVRVSVRIRV